MPLGVIVGLRSINANLDIIVLGWFEASGEIAKYKIAVRFSSVALLGQEIVIMVFSGYFARLFKNNETKLLSDLTKKGALLSTCIAVGVLLLCLFWGDILISLFFGAEFMGSFAPLMIIVFGYTICMPMGMVSTLLNMTGHEKRTALGAAIATILNLVLNIILIPEFGVNGAATALAISMIVWNLYLWRSCRTILGFNPGILS